MKSWRLWILVLLLVGLIAVPTNAVHANPVIPPPVSPLPWQAGIDVHGTTDTTSHFQAAILTWKSSPAIPAPGYRVITYRLVTDTTGQTHWLVDSSPAIKVHYTTLAYATVSGLTTGLTYRFTLRLIGPAAVPPVESLPSSPFTPGTIVPGGPIAVSATAGNGSATLSWLPRLGADISHYLVQVYTLQGYNAAADPIQYADAVANPPLLISNLVNGTTYVLAVRLIDSHGMASMAVTTQVTPRPSAPAPTLLASRSSIEPGDQVVLTGLGFTPLTQISISVGTTIMGAGGYYGTASTDSVGNFTLPVTIARYPDGTALHAGPLYVVAHTASWNQKATVQLQVVTLASDRAVIRPGDTVVLAGDGFAPGAQVTISMGYENLSPSGSYGTAVADWNGHFSVAVTLARYPNGLPLQPGAIVLVAHTAPWSQKASVRLQVLATPLLTADRTTIRPGDHVILSGQGFTPGSWITISLGASSTAIGGNYGTTVTDANGSFTITVVPERYPDGSPLQAGSVVLVAHTFDGREQASLQLWVVRAPDKPTNVSARVENGQAVVTWTPPYNGGSTLTGYRITGYLGTTSAVVTIVTVAGLNTSAIITGLSNGFSYTFTVQAQNTFGQSDESARSNLVLMAAKPAAVRNLTVTAGDESATARWDAPASDGGSAIMGYQITASDGVHAPLAVTVATTSVTLTGLTNGNSYTLTAVAFNGVGGGPAATAIFVPRNLPPTLTVPDTLTVHHGDIVAATITASDVEPGDHLVLSASGLPAGATFVDQGNGSGILGGKAEVPAGTYQVTFTANDGHNSPVSRTMALTVVREQAAVRLFPTAPLSVVLKNARETTAKSLTIRATVREVTDPNGYADISEAAQVTYTLTSVQTGTVYSGTATTTGQGVEGILTTRYTFRNIPRGIYELRISVGGNYYEGAAEAMVAVSSSSIHGGVTASGQVTGPGTNDSARFQLTAQRPANGKLTGSFLYVEQRAGTTYTFKSTSITALVFKGHTAYVQGTGTLNGVAGHQFVATIVDNHHQGLTDRFGLRVIDGNFATVNHCTFGPVDLTSGQARIVHG